MTRLLAAIACLSLCVMAGLRADNSNPQSNGDRVLTPHERALVKKVPFSTHPLRNRSGRFDTRFSEVPNFNWRTIYEQPQIISLSIEPTPGSTSKVQSIADVEGVFPIEPRYLFDVLTDYGSYPRISPRTVYDGKRSALDGRYDYHKRVLKISARFFGFGQTYLLVTNNYAMALGKSSYGLKWNLEQSLDGKLYLATGSWYVQAVRCGERTCSYLRYFNHTGFMKNPPVPTTVLTIFTSTTFKELLTAFYDAAVALRNAESAGSPSMSLTPF